MRAGRLRTRIAIEHPTESRDDVGEADVSWSVVAYRQANIEQPGGSESLRGRQLAALVTDVVTIRHTPNVKPKMRVRVLHNDRTLDIAFVSEDDRRTMMVLDCTEVQ